MAIVSYDHQFDYSYDSQSGELFPILVLQLSSPVHSEQSIDADAYLDTGAQRSLAEISEKRAGEARSFGKAYDLSVIGAES